jgi:hypothetical protein
MTAETDQPEKDKLKTLKDIMGFHFDGKTGDDAKQAFLEDWGMPKGMLGFVQPVTIAEFAWDPNWAPPFPEDANTPEGLLGLARGIRIANQTWESSLLERREQREPSIDIELMRTSLQEEMKHFSPILLDGFEGQTCVGLYPEGKPWSQKRFDRILEDHQSVLAELGYANLAKMLSWFLYIPRSTFHDLYLRHYVMEMAIWLYLPEALRVSHQRNIIEQAVKEHQLAEEELDDFQRACLYLNVTFLGAAFASFGYFEVGRAVAMEPTEDQQRIFDKYGNDVLDTQFASPTLRIANALKIFDALISDGGGVSENQEYNKMTCDGRSYKIIGDFMVIKFSDGGEVNLSTRHKPRNFTRYAWERVKKGDSRIFLYEEWREDHNRETGREIKSDRLEGDLFKDFGQFDLLYERLDRANQRYKLLI